jgi:predicted aldo/keto reductase-like oxidoreductase
MKNYAIGRRDFIKKCLTGIVAVRGLPRKNLFIRENGNDYDSKGLPTTILGKTGVSVPLIVVGCGSRFCAVSEQEKSVEILNYALDNGFYYWDTAHDYVFNNVVSEERLGLVLKDRRQEVFLATKVGERTYDGAMRHLEESLKRLRTDRLDLYQIHLIQSLDDVDKICAQDGVLKALRRAKDEKVTRFIGFSGHLSAEAMMEMVNRYDFDTMLIALNHYEERQGDFEKQAIPAAAQKKMGILAMKAVRPREEVEGLAADDLIRYALSLEQAHATVIGMDSLEVLKKNIHLVKNFTKMAPEEMEKIRVSLESAYASHSLPWMDPSYTDGVPV